MGRSPLQAQLCQVDVACVCVCASRGRPCCHPVESSVRQLPEMQPRPSSTAGKSTSAWPFRTEFQAAYSWPRMHVPGGVAEPCGPQSCDTSSAPKHSGTARASAELGLSGGPCWELLQCARGCNPLMSIAPEVDLRKKALGRQRSEPPNGGAAEPPRHWRNRPRQLAGSAEPIRGAGNT